MIILKVFLKIYEEDFLTQSIKPAFLLYKSQTQHPPPHQKKTYRTISPINVSAAAAKSLQSCPTLCDPIGGSLLGSSVPGIIQARILEWVAIFFSNA